MAKEVYVAAVGLTKVDLTGRIFGSVFDLFAEAYRRAIEDCPVRSFDAVQVGIMDSGEFEDRANIATKVADRLGLTGIPAVRSETASSTGAAAFHEAWYKVASGEFESVLVLAGERMKMVTTRSGHRDHVEDGGPREAPLRLHDGEYEGYYTDRTVPEVRAGAPRRRRVVEKRLVYTAFFDL